MANMAEVWSSPKLQPMQLSETGENYSTPFEKLLRTAEAQSNSLRQLFRTGNTQFSTEFRMAMDYPEVAHHGHHHSRHVEKLLKIAMRDIFTAHPDLFDDEYAMADISAAMLFPYFHDLDQQMGSIRNLKRDKDNQLKVKKGHGAGASAMILAMTEQYAQVNNMKDAWKITSSASIMMFQHDEPDAFDKHFNEKNMQMRTISPSQVIHTVQEIKGEYGFIDGSSSVVGLAPSFEEQFSEQIQQLQLNNDPLLEGISEKRWQRIKLLTEAAYFADMGDMIAPYNDQIMRTFLGQYSRERTFSSLHSNPEAQGEARWNGYPSREARLEDTKDKIMNGRGHGATSDDIRLLWELIHVKNISKDSGFGDLPSIRQFVKDHVILGALALRKMGGDIMRGGDALDSIINQTYALRMGKLNTKKSTIESTMGIHLNGTYTSKAQEIEEECDMVKEALHAKHKPYTVEDIEDYEALVDSIISEICTMYEIDGDQLVEYQAMVEQGIDPQSLPFSNDSLPVNNFVITG